MPVKKAAASPADATIVIPAIDLRTIEIKLIGDSPLIVHAWSEKAKAMIRDKQQKKARQAREIRDPQKEFEDSLYPIPGKEDTYGFPTRGIKSAAVDACSHVADITKVTARGAFHIDGELVTIIGEPHLREDMVRVGMGTADLRYRGEFSEWSMVFSVRYNASVMSAEQIVNLFNLAGFAIGIGEWRPAKDGSNGMFHVAQDRK